MQLTRGRVFIGRFPHQADLLEALTEICVKENIRLGMLTVLGALEMARLAYYNQNTHKYIESLRLDERMEIVSCHGNISLKDTAPFIHAHVVLANDKGQAFGGHLITGCTLFAGEYYIQELTGAEVQRDLDDQTGLSLWPLEGQAILDIDQKEQ